MNSRKLLFLPLKLYTKLSGICPSALPAKLAMVLIYYYGLNKAMNSGLYRPRHWFMFLILNAVIIGLATVGYAHKENVEPHSYITWLAFLNAVYSLLAYTIFSLLFKGKSTFAYTTPVKWPNK